MYSGYILGGGTDPAKKEGGQVLLTCRISRRTKITHKSADHQQSVVDAIPLPVTQCDTHRHTHTDRGKAYTMHTTSESVHQNCPKGRLLPYTQLLQSVPFAIGNLAYIDTCIYTHTVLTPLPCAYNSLRFFCLWRADVWLGRLASKSRTVTQLLYANV